MSGKRASHVNLLVAAAVASALPQLAVAADQGVPPVAAELSEVLVYGIAYRNRTDAIDPVLSYDLEYFQRFEPATVGDLLKRVPGVGFVGSDVMEYDGAQLRGLGGGYTQVLINGKKVPGAGDDRSFWVDRIPAEMVERVEILRSNRADRSGDAIGGAINIVLRDAYLFDGSYVRAGLTRWFDGELNPSFGAVTSGAFAGGRILAGVNVQDRYRRKDKRSDRFADPSQQQLLSWEDQVEVKDGRDYSGNLSYTAEVGEAGRLSLDGFFVKTERDVTEVSHELKVDDAEDIDVPGLNPVDQRNWGIGAEYRFDLAGGTTELSVQHARFQDDSASTEEEHVYELLAGGGRGGWLESSAEAEAVDAEDTETGFRLAHQRPLGAAVRLEFGVDYRDKQRDTTYTTLEWEADNEGDPVVYEPDSIVTSVIKEKRLDPYLQFSGQAGRLSWAAGLRYETTDADISYVEDDELEGEAGTDYDELLPSVHFNWDLTEADRINLSLARSVRRPNFNELIPALLDGEFGDNDYIGNPRLEPETASGFDLGYERRLGQQGVVGINLFYRKVRNLIELVNLGTPSEDAVDSFIEDFVEDALAEFAAANPGATDDELEDQADTLEEEAEDLVDEALASGNIGLLDPDSWLFTSANVGDGEVYGVELDLSTPLSALGLPHTGVFLNYSWVQSELTDFLGDRRFNDQARFVYNIGFIHDLPAWGASFGATYRKQGRAFSRILAEEVIIEYGSELDLFVEKRFGTRLSVRLSASNLLDASKDEFFDKFDNQGDQEGRDYDEYELETEQAGPSYQLVMRWAF